LAYRAGVGNFCSVIRSLKYRKNERNLRISTDLLSSLHNKQKLITDEKEARDKKEGGEIVGRGLCDLGPCA